MLVGYGSSSDDEPEDAGTRPTAAATAKHVSPTTAHQGNEPSTAGENDAQEKSENLSGTSSKGLIKSETDVNKLRDLASQLPKPESTHSKVTEHSLAKKNTNKGSKQRTVISLPLLEEPPSILSDSEDSDDAEANAALKTRPVLSHSSIWDTEDASVALGNSLMTGEMSGANLRPANYAVQMETEEEFVDSFHGQSDTLEGRAMDKELERQLAEGKSISEIDGSFVEVQAQTIRADAKARMSRRQQEDRENEVLSSRVAGAETIEKRQVSSTMKRKHQLTSLAFQAQEQEADLQKVWARSKMKKAKTATKFGW